MGINIRRLGVFNLVGLGGFVLQVGTIALLTRGLDWPSTAATAIGLELAVVHNFIGHSRWTWREYPAGTFRARAVRCGRYQIAKTASLFLNLAVTMFVGSFADLPVELANTIAVVMCALPNYLVAQHLVFTR